MPPNVQLYNRVISFVNGLSKSTNAIISLYHRLVVNCSGSSVNNTKPILSSICCVPGSYGSNINKNTYPVSTGIDDSLAITGRVIRHIVHMLHMNHYLPNISIFNGSELHWILNTLRTE